MTLLLSHTLSRIRVRESVRNREKFCQLSSVCTLSRRSIKRESVQTEERPPPSPPSSRIYHVRGGLTQYWFRVACSVGGGSVSIVSVKQSGSVLKSMEIDCKSSWTSCFHASRPRYRLPAMENSQYVSLFLLDEMRFTYTVKDDQCGSSLVAWVSVEEKT